MDLTLTPPAEGSLTGLVVAAMEFGRAARHSTFHADVLARFLGWDGDGPVAVAFHASGGVARLVADGATATTLLLAVDRSHVVEVDLRAAGVVVTPRASIDDADRADIDLSGIALGDPRPADVDGAAARGAIVLAADAVGAATAAMEAAVAHVATREQWGRPLGVLQAVQHRAADMLLDVTMATDAVFDAAGIVDRGAVEEEVRIAASYAKATAIERSRRVTASAHQLAGGQGIDDGAPFHRWFRRVIAAEPVLGTSRHHREAVARALLDQ